MIDTKARTKNGGLVIYSHESQTSDRSFNSHIGHMGHLIGSEESNGSYRFLSGFATVVLT